MKLYAAINLHANNSVLVVSDEEDRVVCEQRLPNKSAAKTLTTCARILK